MPTDADRIAIDRELLRRLERGYLADELGRIAYRARKLQKQAASAKLPGYCREMAKVALYRLDNIAEHIAAPQPGARKED